VKLSAPLRVTWDWNWPPAIRADAEPSGPGGERARIIAGELKAAKVLMLEVGYPGAEDLSSGLAASVLGGAGSQVSLVLDPDTIAALGGKGWKETGAGEVWADMTASINGQGEPPPLPRLADGSTWPDLRIYLTSANCRAAAALVQRAVEEGCRRLSLPILPLFGSFLASASTIMPAWRDLVKFADHLEPILARYSDLDVRVHNQALWTILRERGHKATEAEAPGHSGCQAAAALAYIDPAGTLYPCAALPVPLGRVEKGTLMKIWEREERLRLRGSIEEVPEECGPCRLWQSCRGGCRGWAFYAEGDWKSPAPDCGRPADDRGPVQ